MAGRSTSVTKHRQSGSRKAVTRTAKGSTDRKPAPALPMLRTSERSTLKTCEFQWYLSYTRRARMGTPAPALRFGTLWHQAMAGWYVKGRKRGKDPVAAFGKLYDADVKQNESRFGWRLADDEPWQEARDLGTAMMEFYLETYGEDEQWEVLATEHPFQVTVYHPESYDPNYPPEAQATTKPWFVYVGVVDGVWRNLNTGEIWIIDHKTTASLSDSKLAYLQLDDQAGAYWSWGVDYLYAKKFLKPEQRLTGMLYSFARKGMPDERQSKIVKGQRLYLNLDGSVSKKQPPPLLKRFPVWRDEPDRHMAKLRSENDYRRIEMLRAGELQIGKTPGMMTCPGCPVRDVCELHEVGQDWEGFLAQTSHTWDPYAEHEIYLSETK